VSPGAHLGCIFPDSPLQAIELCLGCADPEATVQGWQRTVGAAYLREGNGYLVRLGDTPIRVAPGDGLKVVVKSRGDGATSKTLAAVLPDVRFASLDT